MILLYARVATSAASTWFAAGYLLSLTAFSLAATTAQWGLDRAALLTLGMFFANARIAGVVWLLPGRQGTETANDLRRRQQEIAGLLREMDRA